MIAVASDRADVTQAHVALFTLDTSTRRLVPMGRYPVGPGEAYGMCLWTQAKDKALFGFVVQKDGRIDQVAIDVSGPSPRVTTVRSMKLGSQAEGCVVDDRTGLLYVAEEDVGLWRFSADPTAPATATPIAQVDGKTLVADAESLALAPQGTRGGYLVVSSQGDNAYTLYRLPAVTYAGRFRIGGGAIDGTSDTDGIELALGDFGPAHPDGLLVAQDGDNAPDTQNFKYVSWAKVKAALGLYRCRHVEVSVERADSPPRSAAPPPPAARAGYAHSPAPRPRRRSCASGTARPLRSAPSASRSPMRRADPDTPPRSTVDGCSAPRRWRPARSERRATSPCPRI